MLISKPLGATMGEIRDFSANGVLFALVGSTMAISLQDQPVTITFRSGLANTEQYRIMGRVVRVFDRSMGIVIDDFTADAYRALVKRVNKPEQPVLNDLSVYSKAQTLAANAECKAQFQRFIIQVVEHFYGSLEAKLTSLEVKETSPGQRWAWRNAYSLLAARRKEIEQALLAEPAPDLQAMALADQSEKPALKLVDMEEFDDWLAVSQLVHKLNLDYAAEITQFELRYTTLLAMLADSRIKPFGPQRFFWALHAVLSKFGLENQLKAPIYKIFYESVVVFFEGFYAELRKAVAFVQLAPASIVKPSAAPAKMQVNQPSSAAPVAALIPPVADKNNRRILPVINSISIDDYLGDAARYAPAGETTGSQAAQSPPGEAISFDYGLNQLLWRFNFLLNNAKTAPTSQALSDAIMGWSSMQPSWDNLAAGSIPSVYELPGRTHSRMQFIAPSVQPAQANANYIAMPPDYLAPLLGVVNGVQQRRAMQADNDNEISLKSQLIDTLAQLKNPRMLDPLVQTINSFEEALSAPVSSESSHSAIIGLLKKIELPLIKLALVDEKFFQASPHDAQQTVNLLERFHAATDDAGKFFDHRLQRLLDLLVNQIVDQFEINSNIFDEINKILITLLMPIEAARKNKISRIQLAFAQREKNAPFYAEPEQGDIAEIDIAITTAVDLMCQGDWVSVVTEGISTAYQLVCLGAEGKPFLFVNRSVTMVREYSRHGLYSVLSQGQMQLLPEYDLPFMERSAYKGMLNVYAQVCQQATRDPVCGLFNRKALMSHLETIFGHERAHKKGVFLCMIMFDKNNLLCQNIECAETDASFASFIGAIAEFVKPADIFARLSDTTFTIVLHDSNMELALADMKTVMTRIEAQRIRFQDKYFAIGANIGISELTDFIDTPQKLLKTAGAACVSAKKQGINWVELYKPNNKQIEQEQSMFEWAGGIDKMFADQLLYLRCQKIQPVEGSGNYLPHYEILLGLPDTLGINIQGFVLAAEKWNRSADIDLWVLQQSFDWLRAQDTKLDAIGGVSINLSGQSLNNQKIWANIKENLQTHPELASKIIFEITETAVIQNLETAQRFIETTRGYGCRFSLDDFGSGYNSFAYLRTLSLDFLKIDGAFVRDMVNSSTDFAMVKCMHDIAHALGLKTVAEYVESEDILDKLHELGVDYAQGYAVETSKPISELIL
ncbi:MAG: DUF1631 family protein [Sulfuriferula sp.]